MKDNLAQLFFFFFFITVAGLEQSFASQMGSESEYQSLRVTFKKMVLI